MSLFQSNLRKQIRNLPKILNFVKIIHYYSKLFTSLLRRSSETPRSCGSASRPRSPAWSARGRIRAGLRWTSPSVRSSRTSSRRAAAGRAELLAKKGHTGHVQNPVKVSENRPACGTAQHTLAVCFVFEKLEKSRKNLAKIQQNLSKI